MAEKRRKSKRAVQRLDRPGVSHHAEDLLPYGAVGRLADAVPVLVLNHPVPGQRLHRILDEPGVGAPRPPCHPLDALNEVAELVGTVVVLHRPKCSRRLVRNSLRLARQVQREHAIERGRSGCRRQGSGLHVGRRDDDRRLLERRADDRNSVPLPMVTTLLCETLPERLEARTLGIRPVQLPPCNELREVRLAHRRKSVRRRIHLLGEESVACDHLEEELELLAVRFREKGTDHEPCSRQGDAARDERESALFAADGGVRLPGQAPTGVGDRPPQGRNDHDVLFAEAEVELAVHLAPRTERGQIRGDVHAVIEDDRRGCDDLVDVGDDCPIIKAQVPDHERDDLTRVFPVMLGVISEVALEAVEDFVPEEVIGRRAERGDSEDRKV